MVYTLRAIRAERKTIMAAISGFKIDQSTNIIWNEREGNAITTDNQNSKQNIDVVNKKLMGANPIHVIANDLKSGQISKYGKYFHFHSHQTNIKHDFHSFIIFFHRFNAYMNGYLKVLMNNASANMNETDLSADDQVNCLIDLATDPSILGISFEGLTPWI